MNYTIFIQYNQYFNHLNINSKYKFNLSCDKTENAQEKCSRLIFVWSHGGRGINFLDGHGIHLHVSFLQLM